LKFNTALLHQNFDGDDKTGATLTPIYQVSAFAQESPERLEKVFRNQAPGFAYTRIGNPSVDSFEKRMAALEGGIGAVACSSGMAAVTMAMLNILQEGDEIVASSGLFGGTIDLFGDLSNLGITTRLVPHMTVEEIQAVTTERTKVIFAELIGNPGLEVLDIEKIAEFAHSRSIPFLLDCTTATSYLTRAFDYGADIVIHSTSKYINGSGDAISGIIVDSGRFSWDTERYPVMKEYKKFGKFAYLAKLRNGLWRNVGCCLSPVNAFLNSIGMETLGLRMERLCSNALGLAEYLDGVDGITVNYPALPKHPDYPLVQKYLGGKGGAILTIRVGSKERAFRLMNGLRFALNATNIGDVRTLVIHPSSTIYVHSDREQQELCGVYDDLIRISVGIEDLEDIIDDFRQAIEQL
jgi:O-acetylhomoserine (thiol)-lyase